MGGAAQADTWPMNGDQETPDLHPRPFFVRIDSEWDAADSDYSARRIRGTEECAKLMAYMKELASNNATQIPHSFTLLIAIASLGNRDFVAGHIWESGRWRINLRRGGRGGYVPIPSPPPSPRPSRPHEMQAIGTSSTFVRLQSSPQSARIKCSQTLIM
jgi:hypothetical protein